MKKVPCKQGVKKIASKEYEQQMGKKPASGRSISRNRNWLSLNAGKYMEEWVALKDGILLDHDKCSRDLRKRLKDNKVDLDGVLVIVPGHWYTQYGEQVW